MATGDGNTGAAETAHHSPNQEPRATNPTQKHVPELQEHLSILDRLRQLSLDPQVRKSWKTIILHCEGLPVMADDIYVFNLFFFSLDTSFFSLVKPIRVTRRSFMGKCVSLQTFLHHLRSTPNAYMES